MAVDVKFFEIYESQPCEVLLFYYNSSCCTEHIPLQGNTATRWKLFLMGFKVLSPPVTAPLAFIVLKGRITAPNFRVLLESTFLQEAKEAKLIVFHATLVWLVQKQI